jgi:hypothetical protein
MPKIDRNQVLSKYGSRCGYCGNRIDFKSMQVDHIEPKWTKMPDVNDIGNLMPSCRSCNHYKRSDNLEQFREKMATLHDRVCSHYIGKVALHYGIVKLKPFDGKFYFEVIEERLPVDQKDTRPFNPKVVDVFSQYLPKEIAPLAIEAHKRSCEQSSRYSHYTRDYDDLELCLWACVYWTENESVGNFGMLYKFTTENTITATPEQLIEWFPSAYENEGGNNE